MKTKYILIIVSIAVAIGAIVSSYGDASTYESFTVAAENEGKEFHVVGTLEKDKEMTYNPVQNANYFSFYLKDEKGQISKVVYNNPKPPDFERSEKVVIIGKMEGETFHASKILLKCPSKYNENQVNPGSV